MSKIATINMRVDATQRALLNKAAEALGMDRTSFILNVACKEAEEVLLNQRFFQLNDRQFQAFEAALNAPLEPQKIASLLEKQAPWEH